MQRFCTLLILITLFAVLFIGYFHPITAINQDLGRHLLMGNIILRTQSVPKTNLLSYTYPDFPFINHHWLSEVVYASLFPLINFQGLLWLNTLVIMLAVGLLFWHERKTPILPLGLVSLLYLGVLFERTDIRPEMFSFLFLVLFMVILMRFRDRQTKTIYALIPIELLWTNMHIYFPIGIGLIALFLIDEVVRQRKALFQRHTMTLFGIFLACSVVTLLNPNGLAGATYPLHVFQNYGYTIEENQTMFFLEGLGIVRSSFLLFKLSVVLLFLSLLFSFRHTRLIDWLLAITFTVIAGMAIRNFPLFVFATFFTAVRSLSWIYNHVFSFFQAAKPRIAYMTTPLLALGLLVLFFFLAKTAVARNGFGDNLDAQASNGVRFFTQHGLHGPIFNNFDIGSYLEYQLYPKEKAFVDGRPEAFPAAFLQKVYIPMQEDPLLFKQVANRYRFNVIFFAHSDQTPWAAQFLQQIVTNPSWKTVYLDPYVIILVKDTKENEGLIKQYAPAYQNLAMSGLSSNDETALLHAANFYQKIGHDDQEQSMYLRILTLDPDNCAVLGNVLRILQEHNDPLLQAYGQRFQQSCQ